MTKIKNNPSELCDIVYDTIMQNTQHEQFNPSECDDVECFAHSYADNGLTAPYIFIEWRGKKYSISIDELPNE